MTVLCPAEVSSGLEELKLLRQEGDVRLGVRLEAEGLQAHRVGVSGGGQASHPEIDGPGDVPRQLQCPAFGGQVNNVIKLNW